MGKSKTIVLKGKCLWARILEPRKDDNDSRNEYCSMMLECDKETFKQLKKEGLSSQAKHYDADECFGKDDEGDYNPVPDELADSIGDKKFINIKRSVKFFSENQDKLFDFGMPKVVDKYGDKQTELVGNGSDVVCKLELVPYKYKGKDGVKLNLQAVVVKNLVPFEGHDDSLDGLESELEQKPELGSDGTTDEF